jgi:hypothetical protein
MDTNPVENCFYILKSAPSTPVTSVIGFPSGVEYIPFGKISLFSEATTNAELPAGGLKNQNINNHHKNLDQEGIVRIIAQRFRTQGILYESGLEGTGSDGWIDDVAGTFYIKHAPGIAWQFNRQSIPAKDTSPSGSPQVDIHIVNDSVSPYARITSLNGISLDASGASIPNNRYFNIMVYTMANKSGEYSALLLNLPTASYIDITDAKNDTDNTTVYALPTQLKYVAQPIARITLQKKAGSALDFIQATDLREGRNIFGGGSTTINDGSFFTNVFELKDPTDPTKITKFDASGLSTTRLYSFPNRDMEFADVGLFLNQPISELNNHTLKEVFEDGNILYNQDYLTWTASRLKQPQYIDNGYVVIQSDALFDTWSIFKAINNDFTGDEMYVNFGDYTVDYVPPFGEDRRIGFPSTYENMEIGEISKIYTNVSSGSNLVFITGHQATDRNEAILKIKEIAYVSMTALGISISKEKMDYWYRIYQTLTTTNQSNTVLQELQDIQNPYFGKKIVYVGDSITAENDLATKRYFNYIEDDLKTESVNLGVSGTGFMQLQGISQAYYQRILLTDDDADLYVLIGSGNDLSNIANIGTATDVGTTTIGGCINQTITNLLSINPLAKIMIASSTAWETAMPGTTNVELYSDLLKEIAYINGIYYLDVLHKSGLRPDDATFRSAYYSRDGGAGTHPDENGHKWFYALYREAIKEIL